MKKLYVILASCVVLAVSLAFVSCQPNVSVGTDTGGTDNTSVNSNGTENNDDTGNTDTSGNEDDSNGTENNGTDSNGTDGKENTASEVTLSPVDYDFIRGFDASQVDWYDEKKDLSGWKDTDGTEKDFFAILKANGVNTVRLRIWNDPTQFDESQVEGDNTLERTIRMAKRVKNADLDLMLDFHYSDTWADPGRQVVPAAWAELNSADEVAAALSAYTAEILEAVKNQAGIIPRYVQVGNEINSGILLHTANSRTDNDDVSEFAFAGKSHESGNASFVPANLVKYLKAGASAVRSFNPDIKIVLHLAGGTWHDDSWFFDPIKNGGVPFDIIGYSFYPWESGPMTVQNLKDKIEFQKERYGVDVIVAECSSHWHDETDLAPQKRSYVSMTDPSTSVLYADLQSASDGDDCYLKGSVENQKNVLLHIFEETYASGGKGVFAWGGEKPGNWKWGMFSSGKQALESMAVFSAELGTSDADENSTGDGENQIGGNENSPTTLYSGNLTGEGENVLLLEASAFSEVESNAIVTVTFEWVSGSGSVSCGAGSNWPDLDWESGTATFSGSLVSSLKDSGLTVWMAAGVTYTVTVEVE